MSFMAELDTMVKEGLRDTNDFVGKGYDPETAALFAEIVSLTEDEPEPA